MAFQFSIELRLIYGVHNRPSAHENQENIEILAGIIFFT